VDGDGVVGAIVEGAEGERASERAGLQSKTWFWGFGSFLSCMAFGICALYAVVDIARRGICCFTFSVGVVLPWRVYSNLVPCWLMQQCNLARCRVGSHIISLILVDHPWMMGIRFLRDGIACDEHPHRHQFQQPARSPRHVMTVALVEGPKRLLVGKTLVVIRLCIVVSSMQAVHGVLTEGNKPRSIWFPCHAA